MRLYQSTPRWHCFPNTLISIFSSLLSFLTFEHSGQIYSSSHFSFFFLHIFAQACLQPILPLILWVSSSKQYLSLFHSSIRSNSPNHFLSLSLSQGSQTLFPTGITDSLSITIIKPPHWLASRPHFFSFQPSPVLIPNHLPIHSNPIHPSVAPTLFNTHPEPIS